MPLSPIPEILDELRAGRVVILVDDEGRENEGDFVCAAEKVTPQIINFMTRVGAGYLCVPLTSADCERLELAPQATANTSVFGTPLTVSVDGHPRHGVGTGVSAADRVKTIQLLIDPHTTPADFVRPGHINPLRARRAACWCAPVRPRDRSTSRGWPVCTPARSSSRSSTRTARWPACRSSTPSVRSTA